MALNELQISFLTDEQRERYKQLEEVFNLPGWDILKEFASASISAQAQRALNAQNWNEHQLATGARFAFTQLLNLQEVTENEFANLAAQAAAAEEEDDELDYE
jgi:hypothetical protein